MSWAVADRSWSARTLAVIAPRSTTAAPGAPTGSVTGLTRSVWQAGPPLSVEVYPSALALAPLSTGPAQQCGDGVRYAPGHLADPHRPSPVGPVGRNPVHEG